MELAQTTSYPFKGDVKLEVNPAKKSKFTLKLRIPGWARSEENPFGLYTSTVSSPVSVSVNGKKVNATLADGYAVIERKWKKGDVVTLELPMKPRFVTADPNVKDLEGQVAIAYGPMVYCLESVDNSSLEDLSIDTSSSLLLSVNMPELDNAPAISGIAVNPKGESLPFRAIPYYLLGNRTKGSPYKVWMPARR